MTLAQMLLRWCDKECGIFITLCTLVWIFGHNPEMNEVSFYKQLSLQTIYITYLSLENSKIHGNPRCNLHVT